LKRGTTAITGRAPKCAWWWIYCDTLIIRIARRWVNSNVGASLKKDATAITGRAPSCAGWRRNGY